MLIFIGYAYADDVEFYDTKDETENGGGTDPSSMNVKRPIFKSLHTNVFISGNIIHFKVPSKGCTLYVYNEDGDLEYTTAVPDGTVTFALPSTLSGVYCVLIVNRGCSYKRNVIL